MTFLNKLPHAVGSITVHLHGDHHASADDGLPDRHLIQPGSWRTYTYPLTDHGKPERAAFDFYHDHRMDVTGRNVWNGLQGMFITHDRFERKLPLPTGQVRRAAPRVATAASTRTTSSPNPSRTPGTATTTSRASSPAPTRRQVTRRWATTSSSTAGTRRSSRSARTATGCGCSTAPGFQSYDFHLSNDQPFVQIGNDAGLFPHPVVRKDILLGPAQRADVVVDFGHDLGKKVTLESIPRTDDQPGGIGTPSSPIMQFRVTHRVADHTRIPSKLRPLPKLDVPATPSVVWTFGLGGDAQQGTYWTVNNQPYDSSRVDATVPLGATQKWLLQNLSPITHYIHIHEELWHTISRDGRPPPAYEAGLQDTWRLDPGETVEVAARFTDYTGIFMIHCHMLDHEDHGMMAQFAVVKPGKTALPPTYHRPRPVTGLAKVAAAHGWSCDPGRDRELGRARRARRAGQTGRPLVRSDGLGNRRSSITHRHGALVVVVRRFLLAPSRRTAEEWRQTMIRTRVAVAASIAASVVAAVIGAVPSHAGKPRVLLVCNGSAGCPKAAGAHYYKSLQLAVGHARNGDWVLVWPGTYKEATEVKPTGVLTDGLHIRGMDRNGVIFDGKKTGGSAVHVTGVNNTWVENMTGQNYQKGSANAFYWTGVDGYWGNYLTAYNNGDYGLYAYDSTSSGRVPAAFAHDYASWNADSGIYIGGCRNCHAVIVASKSEKNALGYSGTNAGGELYLMNSEWDHNATGILPNTLTSEPDPPQDGAYIVNNYVHDNNDNDVPGAGITAIAPVGLGIGIAGGSNNIVREQPRDAPEAHRHRRVLVVHPARQQPDPLQHLQEGGRRRKPG